MEFHLTLCQAKNSDPKEAKEGIQSATLSSFKLQASSPVETIQDELVLGRELEPESMPFGLFEPEPERSGRQESPPLLPPSLPVGRGLMEAKVGVRNVGR